MSDQPESIVCDECGEPAHVRLADVANCEDCFRRNAAEHMRGLMWTAPCCHPYFTEGRLTGMCLLPEGSEHEHGAIAF